MIDGSMSILDSLMQQQTALNCSLQTQMMLAQMQTSCMFMGQWEPERSYNVGDYYMRSGELYRALADGQSCRLVANIDYCCTDRRPTPSRTNCCNCGAPLGYHFRCEYCGTVNQ